VEDNKAWWQSKTIWGSFITLIAVGLSLGGIVITHEEQEYITEAILVVITGIGGILSLVGRLRAEKKIGK